MNKKFCLAIVTNDFPIPRICKFTATKENSLAYFLKSEFISFWMNKADLKNVIENQTIIHEKAPYIYNFVENNPYI